MTVDPGPDIPPVIDYDFQLLLKDALGLNLAPGVGVQTILSVTDPEGAFADDSIYLFKELDGSITGRVGSGAGNPVAFTVSISDPVDNPEDPSDATLKVDQILAIDHHQYLLDQGFAFNAANGNYYKLVDGDFDWTTASAQAGALGGFLATVTSAQENAFIAGLFDDNAATSPDGAWLGGGDTAVEGVYRWLTGPEAGQLFTYTNWELNALPFPQQEPNDAQFPGDDDFVTIGRFDTSFSGDAGTWNDDGDPSHGGARGYVVEISGNQFDQQAFLDIFGGSDLAGIAVQLTATVTDDDGDFGLRLCRAQRHEHDLVRRRRPRHRRRPGLHRPGRGPGAHRQLRLYSRHLRQRRRHIRAAAERRERSAGRARQLRRAGSARSYRRVQQRCFRCRHLRSHHRRRGKRSGAR